MKKLVLTTVCAVALVGAAFAQGTVSWVTISFTAMTAVTNSTQYSPFFGGAATGSGAVGATSGSTIGFYYELLDLSYGGSGSIPAAPNTVGQLLAWNDAGLSASNSATAGRLTVQNSNGGATVPWATGVTNSIMLAGWSANLGTSWLAVSNKLQNWGTQAIPNAFFGISTTGFIAAGTGNPGATVFNNAPVSGTGTPIFSLNTPLFLLPTVPEPATMALMGLGGLSLLLFRRRQQK